MEKTESSRFLQQLLEALEGWVRKKSFQSRLQRKIYFKSCWTLAVLSEYCLGSSPSVCLQWADLYLDIIPGAKTSWLIGRCLITNDGLLLASSWSMGWFKGELKYTVNVSSLKLVYLVRSSLLIQNLAGQRADLVRSEFHRLQLQVKLGASETGI